MGEIFLMNCLSFFFGLLCLISIDVVIGFILFIIYKYLDLKYFSNLEEGNKKINGTSTNFWGG